MERHEQLLAAGRWLRKQRENRRMSARAFAQALDVAPQSVNNWETGRMGVSGERAEEIAVVLDMDVIDVRRGLRLWVPEKKPRKPDTTPGERPPDYSEWEPWAQEMWDIAKDHGFTDEAAWRAIESVRIQLELDRRRSAG